MDLTEISKLIALVLRHKPQTIGITLDEHGWANVNDLIDGIAKKCPFDLATLEEIVATDNKQRYSFNEDHTLIRANQGHSIPVDVELESMTPPEFLYHGTGEKFVASIDQTGLIPKSRLYVHLSQDRETAVKVGQRHGKPVIYVVKSGEMHRDGYVFYCSVNGVWLTKNVPLQYLVKEVDYSTKISERMWNLPDKGQLEAEREQTFIDDIVQKAFIERELLENLDGIQTVFDGGAGCGRFSILLAKQGLRVTHFDISQPMIDKAKELAKEAGVLDRITFVRGALEDLSAYEDGAFDLVTSFDAPISYTYPNQEKTIGELVRIARKRIMISVSSRLGSLPYLANPIQKNQFILDPHCKNDWVQWCISSREQMIEGFEFHEENLLKTFENGLMCDVEETKKAYDNDEAPWCITYHFMPDELERILKGNGVKNIKLAGPGAFARTIPNEVLVKIMKDPKQRKEFLDFCHKYDSNPYVCGMGKDNLFAKGEVNYSS